jgi:hypothetical protein
MEFLHLSEHLFPLNIAPQYPLKYSRAVAHCGSAAQIHWAVEQDTMVSGLVAWLTASWHGSTLDLLRSHCKSPEQLHWKLKIKFYSIFIFKF